MRLKLEKKHIKILSEGDGAMKRQFSELETRAAEKLSLKRIPKTWTRLLEKAEIIEDRLRLHWRFPKYCRWTVYHGKLIARANCFNLMPKVEDVLILDFPSRGRVKEYLMKAAEKVIRTGKSVAFLMNGRVHLIDTYDAHLFIGPGIIS